MLTFTNEQLRDKVKSEAAGNVVVSKLVDDIDFLPFSKLEESVKDDVKFLNENPLLLQGTTITGWVYDVKTGKVCLFNLSLELHSFLTFLRLQRLSS